MPLLPTDLRDAILEITDPSDPGWTGFPATLDAVRTRWAGAARAYFEGLAAPAVIAGTHATAEAAMKGAMLAMTPAALVTGLDAYAAAIVAGAAAVGVTAVAPPVSVVLPALPPTTDPVTPATALAATIDTWARTGTWTTGGPPAPWS